MFASQGAKGFSATLDIKSSRIIIIYTPAIATKSKSFSFLRNLSISSSQLTRKSQIRGTATLSSILFCCASSAINQWNVKCRTQNEALFLGGKRPFHLNWKFSGMTNRKFWLNGKRSRFHMNDATHDEINWTVNKCFSCKFFLKKQTSRGW